MDQGPMVSERIAAGERFLREFDKKYPIEIAYWLKKPAGRWYLYIASQKLTDTSIHDSYSEIGRITDAMKSPYVDPFQVKPRKLTDPTVQRALEVQRWNDPPIGYVFFPEQFGDLEVEGAYIYAPLGAAAA